MTELSREVTAAVAVLVARHQRTRRRVGFAAAAAGSVVLALSCAVLVALGHRPSPAAPVRPIVIPAADVRVSTPPPAVVAARAAAR